jgi:hypothetical protein
MKRAPIAHLAYLACYLLTLPHAIVAQKVADPSETWDLVQTYQASNYVFYGEVSKIIPEPRFKTGLMGVRLRDIDAGQELPLEPIIWQHAKEYTFAVKDSFKAPASESFAAYLADPDLQIWTHIENDQGDVFLAQAQAPDLPLDSLHPGDTALIFIRAYLGSSIPVIYRARVEIDAQEDLKLLRLHQSNPNISLETIVRQVQANEALRAQQELVTVREFEDEYYKILRIKDLEIRRSLLTDLVERMGYTGLWNYFDYKERYRQRHGEHIKDNAIPDLADGGREKLWQNISGELKKIEFILKARP